ncbi:hypothetical protein MASR1M48_17430 [Lactococcus petauri]
MSHKTEAVKQFILLAKTISVFNQNVFYTTDTDYVAMGGKDLPEPPLGPVLHIIGPRDSRNALFTTQAKPTKQLPNGKFIRYSAEEAVDLVFTVRVLTQKTTDLLAATEALHAFFLNGKNVIVERCVGQPAIGTVTYEVDLTEKFVSGRMVNSSNLKEASGSITIRGVLVSDGQVYQEGYIAENINLVLK